jgi:hypothetical protein
LLEQLVRIGVVERLIEELRHSSNRVGPGREHPPLLNTFLCRRLDMNGYIK